MLIVFDLDGTLIDSIGDLAAAVNRLVAERGGRHLARDEVARMVGEGAILLITRAFEAAGVAGDADGA
ncbi:MAG: phosphoglycolate phosphatase, partial [Acidobacteria bacterium]